MSTEWQVIELILLLPDLPVLSSDRKVYCLDRAAHEPVHAVVDATGGVAAVAACALLTRDASIISYSRFFGGTPPAAPIAVVTGARSFFSAEIGSWIASSSVKRMSDLAGADGLTLAKPELFPVEATYHREDVAKEAWDSLISEQPSTTLLNIR